jgi:hypothetical protein
MKELPLSFLILHLNETNGLEILSQLVGWLVEAISKKLETSEVIHIS